MHTFLPVLDLDPDQIVPVVAVEECQDVSEVAFSIPFADLWCQVELGSVENKVALGF